jgi:DNA-binding protein HU-beta
MNQTDLIDHVAKTTGITKAAAGKVVAAVFDHVTEALKNGEEVRLAGFGSFSVTERGERAGRNPRTGESITLAASKSPKFAPGKALKDAVNG